MKDRGKDWYAGLVHHRLTAFEQVAKTLGKNHQLTKMMGTLAWGRHQYEWGPDQYTLKNVIYAAGALDGMYDILNLWCRDNDRAAQRLLIDTWRKS